MIMQALRQFPLPILSCTALVLFLAVFIGVIVRTFVFTSKSEADLYAGVVLDHSEADRRSV